MNSAAQSTLLAIKECLHSFTDATTVWIVNKMTRAQTLQRSTTGPKTVEECEEEIKKSFLVELECDQLANVVSIPNDATDNEIKKVADQLYNIIVKSGTVDLRNVKTWSERLLFYQRVVNRTISQDEAREQKKMELNSRRDQLETDIQWHMDRSFGCSIASAAIGWVQMANALTGLDLGLAPTVVDSKTRIAVLQAKLNKVENELIDFNNRVDTMGSVIAVEDAQKALNRMNAINTVHFQS